MSTTATEATTKTTTKAPRAPRNGVDTPLLLGTIGAVAGQRELAKFTFRATNKWLRGTHSQTRMDGFAGAGGEHAQTGDFRYDADHPPVLCGKGEGPTPVEFLLHALAACITAGIANIAAARGVTLHEVESTVEGNIDLSGIFGLPNAARNGYQAIRVGFRIRGDAPPEKLREIIEQSRARSAVFDVLTNGVPVELAIDAR